MDSQLHLHPFRIEAEPSPCFRSSELEKILNLAIDNGLQRAADLLEMSLPDVKNRATILGGIEIGRSPGVARVTFRAPNAALERVGLRTLAEEIYGRA